MYKLVIVDDEQIIRNGLKQLNWSECDVEVIAEAKNGIEATEIIDSMEFDILLTDIKMPGRNGIDVSKHLYQTNKKAKAILLSGYGEFDYAKQALSAGVFDYILKPSTAREILEVVGRACDAIKEEKEKEDKVADLEDKVSKFNEVLGAEKVVGSNSNKNNDIQNILKYIYEHYTEQLTLAKLAEHFHFNTVYLSAYIKKKTNYTFLEILTSVRMHHATQLLNTTHLKNGEIGRMVGIYDERYFGQVFKKIYNVTPYEYKKTVKGATITLQEFTEKLLNENREK